MLPVDAAPVGVGTILDERDTTLDADLLNLTKRRRDDATDMDDDDRSRIVLNPLTKILRVETQGRRIRIGEDHTVAAVNHRQSRGQERIGRHDDRFPANVERPEDDLERGGAVAGRDAVLRAHVGRKSFLELRRSRAHRQDPARENLRYAARDALLVLAGEWNSQNRTDRMIDHLRAFPTESGLVGALPNAFHEPERLPVNRRPM